VSRSPTQSWPISGAAPRCPSPRSDPRHRLDFGTIWPTCNNWSTTGRSLRLASARGRLNSFDQFTTTIERRERAFHPRAVARARRVAIDHDPWLARLDRRNSRRDRTPTRPRAGGRTVVIRATRSTSSPLAARLRISRRTCRYVARPARRRRLSTPSMFTCTAQTVRRRRSATSMSPWRLVQPMNRQLGDAPRFHPADVGRPTRMRSRAAKGDDVERVARITTVRARVA